MIQGAHRVAVDIGSSKAAVLITAENEHGRIMRLGHAVQPTSGVKAGRIEDRQAVAAAAAKALEQAQDQAGVKVRQAYFNIGNDGLTAVSKHDKVFQSDTMQVIKQNSLEQAMKTAANAELESGEAVIHTIPRRYVIDDSQEVQQPLGMHAQKMEMDSTIIKGRQDDVNAVKDVARSMGIGVDRIMANQLASGSACLSPNEMDDGAIFVDIGAGTSDIAIFRDGVPDFVKTIGVGGFLCSNDLSLAFGIPFAEAEELKIEHGSALPERQSVTHKVDVHPKTMDVAVDVSRRDVAQLLKDRLQELFQLIQHSVDNPDVSNPILTNITFTGGCTKLTGFERLAKYILQRNIKIAQPAGVSGFEDAPDVQDSACLGMVQWAARNLEEPRRHVAGAGESAAVTAGTNVVDGVSKRGRDIISRILRR